jgi:hypothetical protein
MSADIYGASASCLSPAWQPIETAPKDGTYVLLYAPAQEYRGKPTEPRLTYGCWMVFEHGEYLGDCGGECRCPEYGDTPDPCWHSEDGGFTEEHPPTHWMPLPLPPGESVGKLADAPKESLEAMGRELAAARGLAKELSDTLLELRPLGGSELFIKRGNTHYADPKWFADVIEQDKTALYEARKKVVLSSRRATTAERQRDEAMAALRAETEACAKICETLGEADPDKEDHFSDYLAGFASGYETAAQNFAAAIRARSVLEASALSVGKGEAQADG